MRWWLPPLLAVLAWFAYTLTPFWSLYGFAAAVQAGDTAAVERRVNFRTLRLSLARQISAAVKADSTSLDPRERQRIADAAAAFALPRRLSRSIGSATWEAKLACVAQPRFQVGSFDQSARTSLTPRSRGQSPHLSATFACMRWKLRRRGPAKVGLAIG